MAAAIITERSNFAAYHSSAIPNVVVGGVVVVVVIFVVDGVGKETHMVLNQEQQRR